MINYWPLKYVASKSVRKRTINGLEAIREFVGDRMPRRNVYETLVLGSWNIRNFDDNRFGDGPRQVESLYYIAEIISAFDIIAIQEVCRNLTPLNEVMRLLGKNYNLIITDVTEGPSGNTERLAFIYNTNKVWFRNIAGELVLPFSKQISDVTKKRQFARTPFSCAFQAGWFKFVLSTVHIYYGKETKSSPEYKRRVKEIEAVAAFLADRAKKERDNYILVGDFNIDRTGDPASNALKQQGFNTFQNILGSNAKQTKFFDQISWLPRNSQLRQAQSDRNQGVLNVFDGVYRANQFSKYRSIVRSTLEGKLKKAKDNHSKARSTEDAKKIDKAKKAVKELKSMLDNHEEMKQYYINTWRTYQISDHLPIWVELEIDFSQEYLDWIRAMN